MDNEQVEKRSAELRAADKPMVLEGYAAVFNSETTIGDFREQISPGAFKNALKQDVRFLLNHDGVPFARSSNGSLALAEDEHGLHYRAELLDTQAGRDLYAMVKRGDLNESSFAFTIEEEEWNENLRTIRSVGKLYDVSVTTFGAYSQTSAEARKKEKQAPENEDNKKKASKLALEFRKMKNYSLNDLQALREQKQERHNELLQKIDDESREPSADEMTLARSLHKEIQSLDKQIELKRQSEQQAKAMAYTTAPSYSEAQEVANVNKRFSLTRALNNALSGRAHTGAEAEWQEERKREHAAIGRSVASNVGIPAIALRAAAGPDNFLAQGQGDGQGFVPTNVPGAIEALRAPSVIQAVGTTVINGATGNIQFPRIATPGSVALTTASGVDGANLDAEIGDAANSSMAMDEVTLKPQRAAAKTTYSRLLIEQGGADVERVIAADLSAAMNAFIDDFCFDKILTDCTTGAITTGVITASDIHELEAAVVAAGADVNGAALVSGTGAHSILRGLAQVDSVSALLPNYNYFVTPYMAKASSKPFAYGNFGQAGILAFFGGLDLLADIYGANATAGKVTLHVNRFFDFETRQPAAVACYTGNNAN